MENSSKLPQVSEREIYYYRQRAKNRLLETLSAFFEEEAEQRNITKRDVGSAIGRDPASITRWLTTPSNLTVETISDLLVSLGAEMDYTIAKVDNRPVPNEMHPLIARLIAPQVVIERKQRVTVRPDQPPTPAGTNATSAL